MNYDRQSTAKVPHYNSECIDDAVGIWHFVPAKLTMCVRQAHCEEWMGGCCHSGIDSAVGWAKSFSEDSAEVFWTQKDPMFPRGPHSALHLSPSIRHDV